MDTVCTITPTGRRKSLPPSVHRYRHQSRQTNHLFNRTLQPYNTCVLTTTRGTVIFYSFLVREQARLRLEFVQLPPGTFGHARPDLFSSVIVSLPSVAAPTVVADTRNLVSLSEQPAAGCDTTDSGCDGGLVAPLAFTKKTRESCDA